MQLELLWWSSLSHTDPKELLLTHYGVGFMQCDNFDWLSDYRWISQDPTLNCVIHQHVGEPIHLFLFTAVRREALCCATWAIIGRSLTCGIFLRRRGEVLSDLGLVVLKRSFTVSQRLLDVLSVFCGWFWLLVCFTFIFGHPIFCPFICSPTARDQLTDYATS